jgi:hypothetical protein
VFIISTICFGIMWIGGFYVSKFNNSQGLYFVFLYCVSILPWIIHYNMLSRTPSTSPSYTSSLISWQAKAFWVFAFIVFSAELYHNIIFSINRIDFDNWELIAFSDSVLITFGARYLLVGCLVLFSIIQAILPLAYKTKNSSRGGDDDGGEEEEGGGGGERRARTNRNSTAAPVHPYSDYKPPSSFTDFKKYFKRLLPFIWPSGSENRLLQLMIGEESLKLSPPHPLLNPHPLLFKSDLLSLCLLVVLLMFSFPSNTKM